MSNLVPVVVEQTSRGEREIHVATLTQALRALDGERRAGRITIPPLPSP